MRKRLRYKHWKQRFNPDATFVWTKSLLFSGERTVAGDRIPKKLSENRNKTRRFWDIGVIELQMFTAPDVTTGEIKKSSQRELDQPPPLPDWG